MRHGSWIRRILALVVTVVFALGLLAMPAMAKTRSFSAPKSFSSGSRSFTAPKPSVPTAPSPSRSFSTPKPTAPATPKTTAPAPSKSFSSPAPPTTSTDSKSFQSSDRSFSSESRSFTATKPTGSAPKASTATPTPAPTWDPGKTKYPTAPPVVVVGPTVFDPWYYHDYYWGRPWYWRMWYRPSYSAVGGWALSWFSIIAGLVVLWILLGFASSIIAKRRRMRR